MASLACVALGGACEPSGSLAVPSMSSELTSDALTLFWPEIITSYDHPGFAVSIDGDWAAVKQSSADGVSISVLERTGETWTVRAFFDGYPAHFAGGEVALKGDVLVAGWPGEAPDDLVGAGAADVYRRDGATWVFEQHLVADEPVDDANVGTSVALDGDVIVLGAPEYRGTGFLQGAAYVFAYADGVWTQTAELHPNDPKTGGNFGRDVAIDGDRIAASAPGHVHVPDSSGVVYIFTETASGWEEEAEVLPSVYHNWQQFGRVIDLEGDHLVASGASPTSANVPTDVFTFDRTNGTWQESQRITGETPFHPSRDGDRLIAGLTLFRRDAGQWVLDHTFPDGDSQHDVGFVGGDVIMIDRGFDDIFLDVWTFEDGEWNNSSHMEQFSPDAQENGSFGAAVSIHPSVAAATAPRRDWAAGDNIYPDTGGIYIWTRMATGWRRWGIALHGGGSVPELGTSVAVASETTIFVGAPLADDPFPVGDDDGTRAGIVYRLEWDDYHQRWSTTDRDYGWPDNARLGASMDATDEIVAVGAPGGGSLGGGSIRIYPRPGQPGGWRGPIDLAPGTELGASVAVESFFVVGGAPGDGAGAGAAYVMRVDNIPGVVRLAAPDAAPGAHFGASVDIVPQWIVVGAPDRAAPDGGAGGAYLFRYADNAWTLATTLEPPDDGAVAFGERVAVSPGGTVVVADPPNDAVHVYRKVGGNWTLVRTIAHPGVDGVAHFGAGLDLEDGHLLIGAPLDDGLAAEGGAAYLVDVAIPLGQACGDDAECESGFCVEDECCADANCGAPSSPDAGTDDDDENEDDEGDDPAATPDAGSDGGSGGGCAIAGGDGAATILLLALVAMLRRRRRRSAKEQSRRSPDMPD